MKHSRLGGLAGRRAGRLCFHAGEYRGERLPSARPADSWPNWPAPCIKTRMRPITPRGNWPPVPRFRKRSFDPARGLYRDGEGTDHRFLARQSFSAGLRPGAAERRAHIAQWLGERGMACSVYAAQYLLEGLFENGAGHESPGLDDRARLTAVGSTWSKAAPPSPGKRGTSVTNRIRIGTMRGAPPRPTCCRAMFWVSNRWRPAGRALNIRPNPGPLKSAEGKVPTPLGPVLIRWENGDTFKLVAHPATRHDRASSASGR